MGRRPRRRPLRSSLPRGGGEDEGYAHSSQPHHNHTTPQPQPTPNTSSFCTTVTAVNSKTSLLAMLTSDGALLNSAGGADGGGSADCAACCRARADATLRRDSRTRSAATTCRRSTTVRCFLLRLSRVFVARRGRFGHGHQLDSAPPLHTPPPPTSLRRRAVSHATQQPRVHVNADPEMPLLTRGLRCRQRSNDPLVEGVQPGGAGAAAGVQAGSVVLACCGVGVGGQGQGVRALPSMPLASGP